MSETCDENLETAGLIRQRVRSDQDLMEYCSSRGIHRCYIRKDIYTIRYVISKDNPQSVVIELVPVVFNSDQHMGSYSEALETPNVCDPNFDSSEAFPLELDPHNFKIESL